MDSGQRNASGSGGRHPLPGSEFLASPLGGTMDAPPTPVADTFATEMAIGSTPGPDADTRGGQSSGTDAPSKASDAAAGAADKAKSVASDASSKVQSAASDASSKVQSVASDAKSAVQGAVSDPAGAAHDIADKAKSAAESVTSAAPETLSRVKEWITAHPMVAVGAGLIGGIVLGGSGGGNHHHHHYHGDSGADQHTSGGNGSQSSHSSGGSGGSGGQQAASGLLGMVQQTGLLDTVTQVADRLMKSANGHAAELMRQRVPGFDEQMRQKTGGSPTPAPAPPAKPAVTTTVPARPTITTPIR